MKLLLPELREKVCQANIDLQRYGLVTFTWGNVSSIDREKGLIVIKPSGVDYDDMTPADMVLLDLQGNIVEGKLNPSSDTATHVALYQAYPQISSIVHTHSSFATSWAQSGMPIPAMGTTHADYFYGKIPCARALSAEEIQSDYELNTGKVIIETIGDNNPMAIPGILVKEHAPFAWGSSPDNAVHNAVVLEEVAKMALHTLIINPQVKQIPDPLLDKHYSRKHGENATYGQSNK
ncbi:MAG TPA: L-ribulose-5-phosphate 4-epimerase [Psychromonas sp.]